MMTTSRYRPPEPPTEEENAYLRDPRSILDRTDAQLRAFVGHLRDAMTHLDTLDAALTPEHKSDLERLRTDLTATQGDLNVLLAFMRDLAGYNIRLTDERQSSRVAFIAGYKARLTDLLSQLSPTDQAALRQTIRRLARADDADELPF